MPTSTSEPAELARRIAQRARDEGFDAIGIASPDAVITAGQRFQRFLELGWHGEMDWLARKADRRADPRNLWPDCRAVIMLGLNYGPDGDALAALARRRHGAISVYAHGRDYHDVVKAKLKRIGRWLSDLTGAPLKVFVDTAPVLEKPLAAAAGLGWQGKHTNLVSRELGSWLFLGAIFTSLDLPANAPARDACGHCRRCLDICPTDAFPAPYRLDARRCISYLTIEHEGPIERAFRAAMGNRIYGCDDCLAVCPWNKFARRAAEQKLWPRQAVDAPLLAELVGLDDAAFRKRFAGTAIKRTGRDRFVRNVLIAIGNSGAPELRDGARRCLDDASPLVRGMAVWALARLNDPDFAALRARFRPVETDPHVIAEWRIESEIEP